jgi:serine/threonine protein kinase
MAATAVVRAVIELAPGRRIGGDRYTLDRLLGSGGMASVWLARDERLDRDVAVTLLSDVLALDPSYVERFRREARIAAQLWHPNLVQVYDFDVDHGRPLLVMEVVHGTTLADLLRQPSQPPPDPLRLAPELLGALAHIHAAGVVHRDVKPANVLIGDDGRARLTDFGIAQPTGATRLTMTGGVIGTIGYLAPEVVRGERATPRSDLYSCGVVLAACLDKRSTRDARLERLIERLTAEESERRPPSAAGALELLGGGEPPTAPSAVATPRSRPAGESPTAPTDVATPRSRPAAQGDTAVAPVVSRRGAPARSRARTRTPTPALAAVAASARARVRRLLARPLQATLAGFAAGLVLVAVAVALFGGGGGHAATTVHSAHPSPVPPASAHLTTQLDALNRELDTAGGR